MKTLCAPTPELACFGCCPPIRPAHYDLLDFVGSLRREFIENRRNFLQEGPRYRPIVGYSCWGLGFLDARGRRAGCLLHPFQNEGRDLRYLIDYGNKCRRESCEPSRMFSLLPPEGREFWLPLVRGLNTFLYSSPRANPIFHLMLWGPDVLEPLRALAHYMNWTETELLQRHRFLLDSAWPPRASRYLFRLVLERFPETTGSDEPFEEICREFRRRVLSLPEIRLPHDTLPESVYTHSLPMEPDFCDFLRLGLGWRKASPRHAGRIKDRIEEIAKEWG